jgi:hypothetical protein
MSITRIKSYGISDGAITTNKISGDVSLGVKIASVQIANSSYGVLDDTAVALEGGYLVITGSGFASGCQVIVGANTATSTTFVNSTTIRAQVGAADAGTKTLYVVNTDGGTAIRVNGLTYSATPTWVTGSTLTETAVDEAISIQLNASGATSYQVQTGSTLPTGLSLAANGLLSGTVTGIEDETTYSFTIEAIDDENQESPRSFSITITFGDEYFYATTLLLNGDGANGANNNTFVDSSNNNFAITRNGNVTQGTFSPFSAPDGRWSNYFGTNTSNLIFASNAAFNIGTGNFTVEGFVNFNAWSGTNQRLFLQGVNETDNISVGRDSGSNNLLVRIQNSTIITYSWTPNIGQWYHIAVVRSGTGSDQVALYIDGVSVATGTSSASIAQNQFIVGGLNWATGYNIQGYLSNVRYSNNARINSLPTVPYSSDVNTLLLTCQSNRFKDNSTNNFTLTPNGNVLVTSFAPFAPTEVYSAATNGGSGIFISDSVDACQIADNDSLSFTSTNSWTVEVWVYHSSHRTYNYFFSKGAGTAREYGFGNNSSSMFFYYQQGGDVLISHSYNFYLNTWYHLAYTHDGSTLRFFINGELVKSQNWSGTITNTVHPAWIGSFLDYRNIAHSFHGYLSDLKYTKGSSLYSSSFTLPTSPAIPTTNTQLLCNFTNAGILDYTGKNNLETVGNAQISTSVKKYGTGAMYFDGTGDWLLMPSTQDLSFGTGNFTIEMWIYPTSLDTTTRALVSNRTDAGADTVFACAFNTTNGLYLHTQNTAILNSGDPPTINAWQHVAFVRNNGTLKIYLDGVEVGSASFSQNLSGTQQVYIGKDGAKTTSPASPYIGYIDDLRITKGIARYTSNFTPPTSAHLLR